MKIRHVVYEYRNGLRWFFVDTYTHKRYFLSLNPKDVIYLIYGINILVPPFRKKHINGNWG